MIFIQLQSVKYCLLKISFSSLPEALDFVSRMDLAIVTVYELPADQRIRFKISILASQET
jgi:hypothetical protein